MKTLEDYPTYLVRLQVYSIIQRRIGLVDEEYAKKFVVDYYECRFEEACKGLMDAFIWDDTDQGFDYWSDLSSVCWRNRGTK